MVPEISAFLFVIFGIGCVVCCLPSSKYHRKRLSTQDNPLRSIQENVLNPNLRNRRPHDIVVQITQRDKAALCREIRKLSADR